MATIAVVFDFDDTLVPDSTTALIERHGLDAGEFWSNLAPALVKDGYDPPLAYLRLILDRVGDGRPFGRLTNADLGALIRVAVSTLAARIEIESLQSRPSIQRI